VNAGNRAGDEVVQLYLSDVAASFPVPLRSLAGVKRIFLEPGKKQAVSFTLKPEQMVVVDDTGRTAVEPGDFVISVGGKQPGFTGRADAKTTGTVTDRFTVTGKTFEIRKRLKAYPGR
jgi:beta-glucosidase